jgi:hypothetical protein
VMDGILHRVNSLPRRLARDECVMDEVLHRFIRLNRGGTNTAAS